MRALVVARCDLLRETERGGSCSTESEILSSADEVLRSEQLELIDNALRIHIGIALTFGYDHDGLALLGVDEDMLHALGIWDYTRSKMDSPPYA